MAAYNCYCLYIALKNHFTQESYDFFKYGGKTSISKEAFLSRKDKYQFQKLCRICDETEMRDFLVANFIKEKKWVGDLLDDEATDNYKDFLKRKQSLSYMFNNDLSKIDLSKAFKPKKNEYPPIIYAYLQGDISIETFTILDKFIDFSNKYDKLYGKDDVLWSKIRLATKKLLPFLEYDKAKIKNIIKEKMHGDGFSEQEQKKSHEEAPQAANL
jgi:hypothetical protein